jgi:hypothetical protein
VQPAEGTQLVNELPIAVSRFAPRWRHGHQYSVSRQLQHRLWIDLAHPLNLLRRQPWIPQGSSSGTGCLSGGWAVAGEGARATGLACFDPQIKVCRTHSRQFNPVLRSWRLLSGCTRGSQQWSHGFAVPADGDRFVTGFNLPLQIQTFGAEDSDSNVNVLMVFPIGKRSACFGSLSLLLREPRPRLS